VVDYKDGDPVYVKDRQRGKYVITDDRKETIPVYDDRFETLFPRMWSNQKSDHIRYYKEYGNVKGIPTPVRKPDGSTTTENRPTFSNNLRFFFTYQIGHMYLRYFMWNFAGRQNDIESQGEPENGNWISGIGFIDSARLGDQSNLPASRENPAHNKFYFLPLLLGILGFLHQLKASRKDTWVVALLFLMTGLAIVVYLNQYPLQPRERDYAYTGSFYAFTIWNGLGTLWLFDQASRLLKGREEVAATGVTALCVLLVPVIMGSQGWDDHDRSGKTAARDFAFNYLRGCDKESVLITFGDNDTFPLWYVQEVEGFRTDVRVLNHMLASGHWYAQQMFSKFYDSNPLPLTLKYGQYENGVNNYIPFIEAKELEGRYIELSELIRFIASEDDRTKITVSAGRKMNYLPTRKVRLTVDAEKCVENGIVPRELAGQIVPYIEWEIKQNGLFKNDLLVLDYLATSDWTRALYISNPSSLDNLLGFDQYLHQEGMVYKFMPVKAKNYYPGIGGVNAVKTKEIFSECRWGNLNSPGVLIDRESYRNIRLPRQNYLRAAEVFIDEKKPELAIEMLDECLDNFPSTKVLFDMYMLPFAELYYQAGGIEQANAIVREIKRVYADDMRYYFSLDSEFADTYYKNEIQRASSVLKRIVQISRQAKQEDVAAEVEATVNLYQL
jgi:hypothetical protein